MTKAKHFTELAVEDWNVRNFHDYMQEQHRKHFGIDYQPGGGGWRAEQGILGGIIGTQKRPATHDKALIKDFIDRCMETYPSNKQYPGISFWFMWTYKKNVLQQLEIEHKRKVAAKADEEIDVESMTKWL